MGLGSRCLGSVAIALGMFGVCASGQEAPAPLFYSPGATEATFEFDAWVELEAATLTRARQAAPAAIESQVRHLYGPMGIGLNRGTPREQHEISRIEVEALPQAQHFMATYRYSGRALLQSNPDPTYSVLLPIRPDRIYERASHDPQGKITTACTDASHPTERDFWYFWSPERNDCHLLKDIDYFEVRARVNRGLNTVRTYPDYPRLPDTDGRIRIAILLGMDRPSTQDHNPLRSEDVNASTYRGIRETLLDRGFKADRWSLRQIRGVYPGAPARPKARAEIFVETLTKHAGPYTLEVTLFFGPSAAEEHSKAFHYFLKDAVAHSAVLIYDGHSGSGRNLNLPAIEKARGLKIRAPQNRYQIFYLNGCSSYSYYTELYFGLKKSPADPSGTRNLDFMSNGLMTFFFALPQSNLALLTAIDSWASGNHIWSYQEIADAADSDNLFSVNGDEDNPTEPPSISLPLTPW